MRLKIFCAFFLCVFACSKVNQFKKPISIELEFISSVTQLLGGDLSIHAGHFNMGDFIFDGKRQQGSAVYFEMDYTEALQVPLQQKAIEEMYFDIPQGVYTSINMHLGKKNKPSTLILEGVWKGSNAVPIFVQLELDGVEQWSITAKSHARQQYPLELTASHISMNITLPLHFWIQETQRNLWETATTILLDGKPTILINKKTNAELYQAIYKSFLTHVPCALVNA